MATTFQDSLVQAPSLVSPQRGSLAGTLSRLAFGPGDLDRGTFMLPLPVDAPGERGPLLARAVPSYSPETGIGEWGVGWSADLSIKRFRPRGDINFVDDQFTSPWGRLAAADDGKYYPAGLASIVRVAQDGSGGWIADTGDGTRYSFHADDAISTPRGTFAWMLSRVDTIYGDSTSLDWTRNASGRAFLTAVHWGGRGDGTQYRMSLGYETLATPFTSYVAGAPQVVDRRVTAVTVEVQNHGAYQLRWRYDLTYVPSPSGPAFYLRTITRTLASGQADPTITYDYDLNVEHLAAAQLARVPKLDSFLATYGSIALQPDHAAITDLEQDGLQDVESNSDLKTAHQTPTGFVLEPLPSADGTNSICRPSVSASNLPRALARMHGDAVEPQVLAARVSGSTTRMLICDRLGVPIHDENISGNWQPAANVKLADLDLDRQPDFVRVGAGAVFVLRNTSTSPTALSFAPGPTTALTPSVSPVSSWILDFNGDGKPDLVERTNVSLVAWLGKGDGTFESAGTTYFFTLSNGSRFSTLSNWQFSFGDYNGDGLADVILTQGQNVMVFTNRGGSFGQIVVPGLTGISWKLSLPLIQDLAGSGNEAATFANGTQGMAIELTSASTGLLRSADDGKGTVITFGYDRAAAAPGIQRRHSTLAALTVASSGYDSVTFQYVYGTPVIHSVGKYLVGFASVDKQSPFLTEHVAFLNDDDISGVRSLSENTDTRTPGDVRFMRWLYDEARFRGMRWLRPSSTEVGHHNADASVTLSTTTQYTLYERDFCPTVVTTIAPGSQLVSASSLASVVALPDDLHCLAGGRMLIGAHTDASLDFSYLANIARNELGQVRQVAQVDPTGGTLVLQDVTYDTGHRVAAVGAPGRGTTAASYDDVGRLAGVTDPVGVTTQASSVDPVSEALLSLQTERPGAAVTAFFRYDGRERLQASWDDVSGASEAQPLAAFAYQDATNSAPGRIDAQTLADAVTGTSRRTVDLIAADGETLVSGTWLGDHVALGAASITSRIALTQRSSFIGAISTDTLATMTSADLRGLGTPLVEVVHAGFGQAVEVTTQQQDSVVGTVTTELALGDTELVARVHQPGGFVAESAVDAAGRLVRKTDENGVTHRYTYDALGRLVRLQTPDGVHAVTFDGMGRASKVTRDGIGAITYQYDPVTGLLVQQQRLDTQGSVTDTSVTHYDAVGRPTQIMRTSNAAPSDTSELRFDYDGSLGNTSAPGQLGRLTRVRGAGWERSQLFDALGRAYSEHVALTGWRDLTTDKTYRADGTVASDTLTITDASGAVKFASTQETELDGLGRVGALKVDGAVLYTLSYDAEGRLARADFTSGEAITFDYDPVTHERRGHRVDAPAASGGVHWERDPRGLIRAETYTHDATETRRDYDYDGRGELLHATTGSDVASYTYTASGLPDTISDTAGARSVHHTFDKLTVGETVYTWDAAGRVVGKGDWTFVYGASGQLSHASRPGRDIDFIYDDADQRILKRVDGVPVRANVAGGVLTEDHFIELVIVGGVVAGVLDNGSFTALLTDPRGTPFAGPDGSPGLASPYGVRASHLGLAEVIDYARLGWDPDLDVIRTGVRDYDPKLSQFLTPDPLYFEDLEKCQASPLQCTLYGYAGGNPVSFIDPTGLGWVSWLRNLGADIVEGAATAAGAIVGGAAGAVVGAPTGPGDIVAASGGAVLGAGLARGIASPLSDFIRGEKTSPRRQLQAVADGMASEIIGQIVIRYALPYVKRTLFGRSGPEAPGGAARQALGAAREVRVAEITNGQVSGEQIKAPSLGSTDIDVVAGNGDLVLVGGPKKADNLGNLGRVIKLYLNEAARRGVGVQAYYAAGTPQNVLDFTIKRIGVNNVFKIPE